MNSRDYSTNGSGDEHLDGLLPGGYERPEPEPANSRLQHVDQVAIRKVGGFNFLSTQQWLEVDRDRRMAWFKADRVVVLSQGAEVPLRSALLYLKALGQQGVGPADEELRPPVEWGDDPEPPPSADWGDDPEPRRAPPPRASYPTEYGADYAEERRVAPPRRPPSQFEEDLDPDITPRRRPEY